MEPFSFALVTLAVWRLARMLAGERGPFEVFSLWRGFIAKRFPPDGYKQSWIDEGVNCGICLSFWLGFASAWILGPADPVDYVVYALAISAGVTILIRLVK